MTDHLADARACLSRVDQAATAATWLRATCEHILDHLEAQQTEASLRRGLADITAGRTVDLGSFAQPETGPACRERWPECRQGGYDPACCRFPKSCSCDASPQPVTAPPAAQQGDSGHGDGGEAADAQGPVTWLTQVFRNAYVDHMTALDHEEGKSPDSEAYKRDFNLWRDHLRAQAWDKGHAAAIEAVGDSMWGEPTTAVNPYRQEQP